MSGHDVVCVRLSLVLQLFKHKMSCCDVTTTDVMSSLTTESSKSICVELYLSLVLVVALFSMNDTKITYHTSSSPC